MSHYVHVLAGGEAGPSNIEESRSESRKKSKAGAVPSRPLPVTVCKEVISKLALDEKWQGWAFDGRKNIYTAKDFMDINQEHNFKVGVTHLCFFCSLTVGTIHVLVILATYQKPNARYHCHKRLASCMVALVLLSPLQHHIVNVCVML